MLSVISSSAELLTACRNAGFSFDAISARLGVLKMTLWRAQQGRVEISIPHKRSLLDLLASQKTPTKPRLRVVR